MRTSSGARGLFVAGWLVGACTGEPGGDTGETGDTAPLSESVRLDPTCAGSGRAVFPVGVGESVDEARAVKRASDGSTLVVGTVDEPVGGESIQDAWFASMRLRQDCTVDTGYAQNGLGWFFVSEPDYQIEDIHRVRFEDDGTTTLFGTSVQTLVRDDGAEEQQPAVTAARIDVDGDRDEAFGVPFVHVFRTAGSPYPDDHVVRGIHTLPDGGTRLLTQTGGPYGTFALLTLDPGGRFVPAALRLYAVEGTVAGLEYAAGRVEGLRVLPDGSTLIGGSFTEGDGHESQVPGVLKLDPEGNVDPTFGVAGVAGVGSDGDVEGSTFVAVQPDGRILLAGVLHLADRYQSLGVVRLEPDGTVDPSFGEGGVARVDLGERAFGGTSNVHALSAFVLNPDGTMLLGGDLYSLDAETGALGADRHVGVTRLLADGTRDPSFADDGVFDAASLSQGAPEYLNGLDQAEDGTVTVAATREIDPYDSDWVIYRLSPQP